MDKNIVDCRNCVFSIPITEGREKGWIKCKNDIPEWSDVPRTPSWATFCKAFKKKED